MHSWSDTEENIDWQGISEAANYIGAYLRKWGRMNVSQTKEKFGTVRVYVDFGWHQLHSITHPGYHYSHYPKWLWKLDCTFLGPVIRLLNRVLVPVHRKLYTRAYGKALERWPHLREEILNGADYSELLTEFGMHTVRTGSYSYQTYIDWHPDNYSVREKDAIAAREVEYRLAELGMPKDPVKWLKRDYNE